MGRLGANLSLFSPITMRKPHVIGSGIGRVNILSPQYFVLLYNGLVGLIALILIHSPRIDSAS